MQLIKDLYTLANREMFDRNYREAFRYIDKIKTVTKPMIKNGSIDAFNYYKKTLLLAAPHSFHDYILYLEMDRDPDKRFYLPRIKVMRKLVAHLQDLTDGKIKILTLSMPPGTGKSTLGIIYLTWIMGRNPLSYSIASGHSSSLTKSFFKGVLEIILDPEYNYAEVFPTTHEIAAIDSKDQTISLVKKKRIPTLTCRSIEGSLTGVARCNMLLYADDLVSGIEQALSKDRMDKLWVEYTANLKSRKMQFTRELHIATRWSVHDPIGRLELEYSGDPEVKFVRMPALDENGESNFDYEYGVGFSTAYYKDMMRTCDPMSWRALYMNEPVEREGLVFPSESLQYYTSLPEDQEPDGIVAAMDVADGGGDAVAVLVAYIYGDNIYIEDVVFNHSMPDVTDMLVVNMVIKHNVHRLQVESNAGGRRASINIADLIASKGGRTSVTTKHNSGNKLTRILVNSPYIKTNMFFKARPPSDEYAKFMIELCGFTQAGRNKNDDAPDATAQLSEFAQVLTRYTTTVFKRPI